MDTWVLQVIRGSYLNQAWKENTETEQTCEAFFVYSWQAR